MPTWFDIDKDGLRQVLSQRGPEFMLSELISNCWDTNATRVDVTLEVSGRGKARLVVVDNDPDGFKRLSDAWTMFAPSLKKDDSEKRGRFNLGEKLVLAMCDVATIETTTGTVTFDSEGRHESSKGIPEGSRFTALVNMKKADVEAASKWVFKLIPPPGLPTYFNGEMIPAREAIHSFFIPLPTVLSDDEGNLRPTTRKANVNVYKPLVDETGTIYELGIPIVENGDTWHYDIEQKVPLNVDRDNVTPAYLRKVRTAVLNEMFNKITEEDANSGWVKEALGSPDIDDDAVCAVITKRFGEKVVAYDPSDQEANNLAVSKGYTVVHGRSLSKAEWENVKRTGAIQPAGQVTPSNSKVEMTLKAESGVDPITEDNWTEGQGRIANYARRLGKELLGKDISVEIFRMPFGQNWAACYGGSKLSFNLTVLGHRWFDDPDSLRVDALLIHEFAHDRAINHLDHSFHDETCRLGALMKHVNLEIE